MPETEFATAKIEGYGLGMKKGKTQDTVELDAVFCLECGEINEVVIHLVQRHPPD